MNGKPHPEYLLVAAGAFVIATLLAVGCAASAGVAHATSYGPDVTSTTYAISGGDNGCGGGHGSTLAFDNGSGAWCSSQTGTGINLVAYIGQDFGAGNEKHIRQVGIKQFATTTLDLSSVLIQFSSDCSTWNTVTTLTGLPLDAVEYLWAVPAQGPYECWRLLAGGNLTAGNAWTVTEIEMMEEYVATPTPSNTPTITATPTNTATPTPNYSIEVTTTLGAPIKLERSATYGDVAGFGVMLAGLIFGAIAFTVWFWTRRA